MKVQLTTIVAILGLMISLQASANDALGAIMKKIGADFKGIGQQVANPSQNAASLALAQDLATQFALAKDQVPDVVASGAQTEADFQTQIGAVQDLVTQLVAALQANDNAKAAGILAQIKMDKNNGHQQFDPQP